MFIAFLLMSLLKWVYGCSLNSDCPVFSICVNTVCYPSACTTQYDCNTGLCIGGQCSICTSNFDCVGSYLGGTCLSDGTCGCNDAANCQGGLGCVNQVCDACGNSNQCYPQPYCINDTCTSCIYDVDCTNNQLCQNGTCINNTSINFETLQALQSGLLKSAPIMEACLDRSTCNSTSVCINNQCVQNKYGAEKVLYSIFIVGFIFLCL